MYYDEFGDQDCVTLYEKGGKFDSKEEEVDECKGMRTKIGNGVWTEMREMTETRGW